MNKKGFTLTELLAVIAIISLISGIAAISYSLILKNSQNKSFTTYENTMQAEVMEIMLDATLDPSSEYSIPRPNETLTFSLSNMVTKGQIKEFVNPINKSDNCQANSYVSVRRIENATSSDALKYKVCLICSASNYNNCRIFPAGETWD